MDGQEKHNMPERTFFLFGLVLKKAEKWMAFISTPLLKPLLVFALNELYK